MDRFVAPLEVKFAGNAGTGEFEGYGAVFGNVDSHGDMIVRGAFNASLSEHKARGTMPIMYVQHGPTLGADPLPAGVWHEMEEDDRGLRVKGKLSALDTDYGRRIRGLMADGALNGLSIGFKVATGGASYGKAAGEPRRTLKAVHLPEVSLVPAGSNALAKVDQIKALVTSGEIPQMRELREGLREQFGFSRSQAELFMEHGYKSLLPRDEDGEREDPTAEFLRALRGG